MVDAIQQIYQARGLIDVVIAVGIETAGTEVGTYRQPAGEGSEGNIGLAFESAGRY